MDGAVVAKRVPWWHLHRRTYDWVLHWADTRFGAPVLGLLAFAESSFFPIPPDVLLIALVLGSRRKAWRLATLCSLASVVGGVCGYGIGTFAWSAGVDEFFFSHVPHFDRDAIIVRDEGTGAERAVVGLIDSPKDQADVDFTPSGGETARFPAEHVLRRDVGTYTTVRWAYERWNFWVVFTAGFTPLPYKVITITAGVFEINFLVFLVASGISRSARFFLVAGLIWWAGPAMKRWIEKYFNLVSVAFVLLLIGGFLAIKYLG